MILLLEMQVYQDLANRYQDQIQNPLKQLHLYIIKIFTLTIYYIES